ncbi:McrB family protein [Rhizobium ruizarguesonis]|uniref:McrB family protein n=1 Tax=Rhizobium ruizarguesonis TaxID=2081791 RepID=UPI00102FBE31|nr:AAA family ATPase [Rhizobium ruizarguesonis]TAW11134.1 AAA family ATPase [Rhizobium ruizarguesonis]
MADEIHQSNDNDAADADDEFRWKQSRENLLSPSGIRLFQLAYECKDQEYEAARAQIDRNYETLSPRLAARGGNNRNGGSFINFIGLLEELGLMYRSEEDGKTMLRATPAGDQAALLLNSSPNLLRVVPYFFLDVLSRYSLNNPHNRMKRDPEMRAQVRSSDMFPYWTIYKIMRELGGHISKQELQRFVFKLKKMAQVPDTIEEIKRFRKDVKTLSASELNAQYGAQLEGAAGQPKYIMGRAGFQTGVIRQKGDVYTLNEEFIPFIDEILKKEPSFEELDEDVWIAQYGQASSVTEPTILFSADDDQEDERYVAPEISAGDEILDQVIALLEDDAYGGVLLVGAPGTGKSWYARQIALVLVEGDTHRLREIQFHPSYQYEDFVEGLVPGSAGEFKPADKHLLQMCALATKNDDKVVLVIDEFSRADPVRVMGEALTYMDASLRNKSFHIASGRKVKIPSNLIFLATMNPEDRSVDEMDAAMERRWAKIELKPSAAKVNEFLKNNGIEQPMRGAAVEFFQYLQERCVIGHAYFRRVRDRQSMSRLWNAQLLPLIKKQHRYDADLVERLDARATALMLRWTEVEEAGASGGAVVEEQLQASEAEADQAAE